MSDRFHRHRSIRSTSILLAVLLCSGLSVEEGRGQTPTFPDTLQPQSLILRTERFSSTHNASFGLNYLLHDPQVDGLFKAYLLSSTTLIDDPLTRDEIDLLGDIQYHISSPVNLFVLLEGTMTNDNAGNELIRGLNNTAATFLGVGGRTEDEKGNRLSVAVGGAYNRQLNTEDAGGAIYGDGVGSLDINGYQFDIGGNARWYNTSPRLNSNLYLNASISKDYGDGVYLNASSSWEVLSNDLYIKRREEDILLYGGVTYDGILKRRERRFRLGTLFSYPIDETIGFDADLSISNDGTARWETEEGLPPLPREPEPYTYDQQELSIGGSVGGWYEKNRFRTTGRMSLRSSEQQNVVDPIGMVPDVELRRKRRTSAFNDYASSHVLLSGQVMYRPGSVDTISLAASTGIYRYDTPDTTNNFDKDEGAVTSEIRYARRFSEWLQFEARGQVFLNHLVYLFGENSGDNNWNRIFRLAPTIWYHLPDQLSNRFRGELIGNYTDYDFQDRAQEIRGRSFRELVLNDSLVLFAGRSLGVMLAGELRIAERGSFSWELFAESLLERSRTELLEAAFFHGRDTTSLYSLGARLSRVRNFRLDPTGQLVPNSDRTSFGPTARILYPVSDRTRFVADGWLEFRFSESDLLGTTPWLFLTLDLRL